MDEFNLDTEQTGDPVVDDRISDVEEPIVDEENDEIIGVMLRRSLVLIFFVAMVGAFVYVFVIRESEPEIAITETERKVSGYCHVKNTIAIDVAKLIEQNV